MKLASFSIVAGICVTLAIGAAFFAGPPSSLRAKDQPKRDDGAVKELAKSLIGTWELVEPKPGGSPSGEGARLKFFTGTHWCITQADSKSGVVVFHHGGRYTLDGNKLKTTREFAAESTKSMIGTKGTFTIEIDGDAMKQSDADGVFNETWKRVK